jgi:serine/threonine-protein kinase
MTPAPESARLLGASTPSSWPPPSLPPTAPVPLPDWHERTATVPSPSGARIVPAGYQIVGQPKRGGMAIVYKAYQPALDRYVALKMLSPEFSSDPEFLRRFHDEAKRTARLEHPHIVPIYDIGQVDGRVFIAMRWIDGLSLQELLAREGPLSARRALAIAAQVADALDYAHARGVVHRDVKPANMMIEAGDRVTLTDFGIARLLDGTQYTQVGMIIGTPAYMSPEQAAGQPVDARSDLYSLGLVVYEMLTGRLPFEAPEPLAVAGMHRSMPPPPPTAFNRTLPRSVGLVVLRALAKRPDERYASGREFVAALRRALGDTV